MTTTTYRGKADAELAELYNTGDDAMQAAVIREMSRRDRAARQHAKDVARWQATYAAWHEFAHAQYLAAEAETRGNLVIRDAPDGFDPWSLWTGSDAAVAKYASEELRNFWDANPRLTVSQYHQQARRERRIARQQHADETE
jgi:hypothetical protein